MTERETPNVALGHITNISYNWKLDYGDIRKLYSVILKETPGELDFHLITTSKDILSEIQVSQ